MVNLYTETMALLDTYGKTVADIAWVGTPEHKISWADFAKVAKLCWYDNTTEQFEIAQNLVIIGIGTQWGLQRVIQSRVEQWMFSQVPAEPSETLEIENLSVRECITPDGSRRFFFNATLEELNSEI